MRYITAQSFYKHVIGATQTQVNDETKVVSIITKVTHTYKLYPNRNRIVTWNDPRHSYIVIDEQDLSAYIDPEMIKNPGLVPGIILQLKYVLVGCMHKSFVYHDDHLYMSATGGFYAEERDVAGAPPWEVTSVTIANGGHQYTSPPTVKFAPAPSGGVTATGTAVLSNIGAVTGVIITNTGYGYTSPPQVTISGGGGIGATATAALGQTCTTTQTVKKGESIKIIPVNLDDILDIVDIINKRKYFNKIVNGMQK